MNILILAGGTGSISLQQGIYSVLENNDPYQTAVNVKVLTNCYDNGLSTGIVRTVCDGKILGPSDLRKNQTTRYKIENDSRLCSKSQGLDTRFSCERKHAKKEALALTKRYFQYVSYIEAAVEAYFESPHADQVDYNDFSFANIIYAGLAKMNGNSLRKAGTIMADLLGLKDNVILNDDTSLYLGAITKSGQKVMDEADIVSWNNLNDPFVDVFFYDINGQAKKPVLCQEAKDAIAEADMIILSSGTQWSSLIPTYASVGFSEAIQKAKAKIVMVMNRVPDKDSPGQTADDIVSNIVPKYFPKERIHLLIDSGGHDAMYRVKSATARKLASVVKFEGKYVGHPSIHDPNELGKQIAFLAYQDYLKSDFFMFDYDDTLVGRGSTHEQASKFNRHTVMEGKNLNADNFAICSGNGIKAIDIIDSKGYCEDNVTVRVFADGGINEYCINGAEKLESSKKGDAYSPMFVGCLNKSLLLDGKNGSVKAADIVSTLEDIGISKLKIENRGNVMVCIKPVIDDYKKLALWSIKAALEKRFKSKASSLLIRESGRSTIEISKFGITKQDAVNHVLSSGVKSLTYVGDEFYEGGNDVEVLSIPNVKCLKVNNPSETSLFLKILTLHMEQTADE